MPVFRRNLEEVPLVDFACARFDSRPVAVCEKIGHGSFARDQLFEHFRSSGIFLCAEVIRRSLIQRLQFEHANSFLTTHLFYVLIAFFLVAQGDVCVRNYRKDCIADPFEFGRRLRRNLIGVKAASEFRIYAMNFRDAGLLADAQDFIKILRFEDLSSR